VTETAVPVTRYETMKIEITSTITVIPRNTLEMASSTSIATAVHTSSHGSGNGALPESTNTIDSEGNETNTASASSNISNATATAQQQSTDAVSNLASTTTSENSTETTAAYTIIPNENAAVSKHNISNLGFITIFFLLLSVV